MPIYNYKCPNCENTEEIFLKVKNYQDEQKCSKCKTPLKKQLTAPNLHGLFSDPQVEALDSQSKNELDTELHEWDQHKRDQDNRVESQIRSGEFIS